MISLLDKWLLLGRVIADASLPPCASAVAYVLLNHHNAETGRCDPSRLTIAAQVGVCERTTGDAITALIGAGYFRRQRRGYPQTSHYEPVISSESDRQKFACQSPSDRHVSADHSNSDRQNPAKVTGKPLPTNPSIEPVKKSPAAPLPFPTLPATHRKTSKTPRRHSSLYKSESGCTIDSYQPDPEIMGAWAAEKTPLVPNPVAPETVEEIKDVWRRRGEKSKDFDATYRNYLRKRQQWAAEKAGTGATTANGATNHRSRAAI